ncbi:MAG: lysophospholipid acyltransferase family protein [Verrucomicrobiales bacterium]
MEADSPGLWRRLRFAVEAWAVQGVAWGVPRLSRRSVLRLAAVAGRLGYWFDGRGRATGRENLRVVFPEKPAPWRESVLRASYASIARTMLDLFWGVNLNSGNWRQYVEMNPMDPGMPDQISRTGALWCCPHYSNFEWTALVMPWWRFPMMVVAQDFKNPALTPLFAAARGHSGHVFISSEGAMLKLFKNLKRGGHSAFLCDLTVPPDQAATIVRAFGLKMATTQIHAALAQRTGRPVVPVIVLPEPDGTYRHLVWPSQSFSPDQPAHEIAQKIWDFFEPVIRDRPEGWLWMYKHFRYRPAHTDGLEYPAYANRSKKFDALERELGVEGKGKG